MTSLQREEFFELVATAQARRLDDQRAQLHRSPLPKSKSRSFRGSIKQLSFVRKPASDPTPAPVPKEDLYNMILTTQVSRLVCLDAFMAIRAEQVLKIKTIFLCTHFWHEPTYTQAQGRLEDQRSRAPGPMDDEDFFSLLLRVQGGRMDEQRTELPCMLQTWDAHFNKGCTDGHPVAFFFSKNSFAFKCLLLCFRSCWDYGKNANIWAKELPDDNVKFTARYGTSFLS